MISDSRSGAMRWALAAAVVIIVAVGTAAFVLSFAALRDLAILANTPEQFAWLFPVIVDGTIIQATVSALVLAKSPERKFFMWVLGAGAVVSVAGNSLHAFTAGQTLPGWASALVAAIAPISLLVDTHGLAVLFRAANRPAAELAPEATAEPTTESAPLSDSEPVTEPVPTVEPVSASPPITAIPTAAPVAAAPVAQIRPPRPAQAMLPIAVPVGGP
jgi:hypothetical protein